jgi:hypothetical protein
LWVSPQSFLHDLRITNLTKQPHSSLPAKRAVDYGAFKAAVNDNDNL